MFTDSATAEPIELTCNASTSATAPAAAQWVHLLPAGSFGGRDGRGPYTLDADAVLAAFAQHKADLPLDYEHQSLDAQDKSGPVPAAGWIKALQARADGIWAQVQWTAQAAALLADKAYRYLSPVFHFDKRTGRITALAGAGLVHSPNLTLSAVAHQKPGAFMEQEFTQRIAALLSLPADTSAEDILSSLQTTLQTAQAAQAAQTAQDAQTAQTAQATEPDVPLALHRQVAEQLATLQNQVASAHASAAVDAAQAAGKLPPAMREWALDYARANPAGFTQYVAGAPQIVATSANNSAAPAGLASPLSADEQTAARLLGISVADFASAKTRQRQP